MVACAFFFFQLVMPDLYRGDPWPQKPMDETFLPWLAKHSFERILSDTSVAADALRERGFGKQLGLLGFCLGGGRVLDEAALAEKGLNPAAVVSFYGTRKFLTFLIACVAILKSLRSLS